MGKRIRSIGMLVVVMFMAACEPVAVASEVPPQVTESPVEIKPEDTITPLAPVERAVIEPENAAQITDTLQVNLPVGGRPQFNVDGSVITIVSYTQVVQVDAATLTTLFDRQIPEGRSLMVVAPDGHLSAWTTDFMHIDLVDLESDTVIGSIEPGYILQGATFSPDGNTLALVSNEDWRVELWDVTTLTRTSVLEGFETAAPVYTAVFTHDPQHILYIARASAQVQDIQSGEMSEHFYHEDFIGTYDLAWQGDLLAVTNFTTINNDLLAIVQLWDIASGESAGILTPTEPANQVAFSPNGRLIAVGTGGVVQLWDRVNQYVLAILGSGETYNVGLAFSPDGTTLVACDDAGLLTVWQVAP